MAFRGGRGRGRGRGGGRAGPLPIRDDEGNFVVIKRLEGPPPLFPLLEMFPEKPKATSEETELVICRRALNIFWEGSSYHIEKPKAKFTGIAAEIDRYADKKLCSRTRRLPLSSSVLKLTSSFFPTELLGREKKRIRPSSTSGISQWTIQAGAGKSDLRRLDKLASLEQKLEKLTEKGGKNEEEKKEGEGEGEEDGEVEEDEELDDDYAQNFGFDDDEDYDFDDDGGGGDDEATF